MADTSVKQQIVDKLKDSSTILVAVNSNPSVDELSGALGITLLLNKLNKHATAVFSGAVPHAIEFLKPEQTFENTVDSLRDFIIALDKEKADHLRYKVVDDMVKIFITPYKTTISEKDLEFSQGDYNVEAVLAIGVQKEEDLDRALESHGRILHDATVASLSLSGNTSLGGIDWVDTNASSYSEMLFSLAQGLKQDKNVIDEQIATAFLTGIVAATDRFSNDKTSSDTMTLAANLMAAGANQQLIATRLEEDSQISNSAPSEERRDGELREGESTKIVSQPSEAELPKVDDGNGSLSISHVPEGTLDEITKQVAAKNAEEARVQAEEQLAEHTSTPEQAAASTGPISDDQRLIDELRAPVAPSAITEEELLKSEGLPTPVQPLQGPVTLDKWQVKADTDMAEPSMGGTLNATTEQAEDDKRRELEADRNRTILSHGGGGYASSAPAYQAPLNASMSPQQEPQVKDIFDDSSTASVTVHAEAIQPPAPVAPAPTLAEIDEQNRATSHADALGAVHEAFSEAPSFGSASMPPAQEPSLPPLPPLPDFSTLPPLPGIDPVNGTPSPVGDTLGDLLPPASAPQAQPGPADPTQFKIPGQN